MPYSQRIKPQYKSRRPQNFRSNRRSSKTRKSTIHPSKFVKAAKPTKEIVFEPVHVFEDFSLAQLLKDNLAAKGITVPTAIQDEAIPLGLEGKDIVGIANTGTGKTIAFGLPVLEHLLNDAQKRAIILAPTRELAQQIDQEFAEIARGSGIYAALLIGGMPMPPQLRELKANPQIVIGTPGRIKDHLTRGSLDINGFNIVVLDEVDRMLDMGFVDEMREILSQLSPVRQSYFFSATMDKRVQTIIGEFSENTVSVTVKTGETSENVHQDIVPYQTQEERLLQLHNLLVSEQLEKAIVFDETQRSVERLSGELIARGFKADAIHGGKSQSQRKRALDKFKKNHVNILVATDVAARGIDISDITHVINYSTPEQYEDYVHRIGRAGRAGRTGYAYTFVKA